MSSATLNEGVATARITRRNRLRQGLNQGLAFGSLLIIWAVFAIANSRDFPTYANTISILFASVVIGLLALGETFVIITSGIDLSVGTGMTLCAVMGASAMASLHVPAAVGVLVCILFGAIIGLVNGLLITRLKMPPFIATLATMMICQGLALVFSHAAPVYIQSTWYMNLSLGDLIPGSGFPNAVAVFVVAAIIAGILLSRTVFGTYDLAIGSNEEATRLSGISVKRWIVIIYMVAGLFTGLAGVMISARLGSAQPATGSGYELQAVAAVVIGGTSLSGGRGSILGTVIGALIIAVINNGLQILSVPQQWQNVILGAVIVFAVYLDQLRKRAGLTT